MKPGDLVRFVPDPLVTERSIIPNERPVGIVIEIAERIICSWPGEPQAIMKLALVHWFPNAWNSTRGLSEEHPDDLEIIQSL